MAQASHKLLILASSSPRRQELIRSLGWPFEIRVSEADETVEDLLSPAQIVEMLSLRKANAVYAQRSHSEPSAVVIGSDTIVVFDGQVLGKPVDEEDSFRMLSALQGNTHEVFSGVACVDSATGEHIVSHRVTRVKMKPLSSEQIARYIATGEPSDKAGSYAIQGLGATIVEGIEGDYFNVVGLPLSLLSDQLKSFNIHVL
ncbi:Maf family protein [Paenibacillus eucommiae]|uniref:dTTP/UTP pyrophosphatase n=1 Tax=Paenibacillus eucommiae TaxID=1355755 RepID=A0ABS4J7U5_9BACL|nr:Maf family protein [Paenibacillus eucommiae]MBP1995922.1 septum formation protein [Paenibacillus eucommiae]